ncbi:hypothetical protein IFM89_008919 [Coptis chinensis]|uniref:Uncharacterized protein n=1 Tax=Coptis chinensis TaxID=261450 RepID=A0A835H5B4_9MAGN|nr:hypothetical protein IFM89_008919 [Coptis chinensis]
MHILEITQSHWKRLVSISNKIHRIPDSALVLPQNTQYLHIQQFNDITRFSELLCLKEARDLRMCCISACRKMECIMSSEDETEKKGHLLQHVEMLEIEKCPNVKFLFSSKLFKQLQKLAEVRVTDCDLDFCVLYDEVDADPHRIEALIECAEPTFF